MKDRIVLSLVAAALVVACAVDPSGPSAQFSSGESGTGVHPVLIPGNLPDDATAVCEALDVDGVGFLPGEKFDPPISTSHSGFTFDLSEDRRYLDWTATGTNIMKAVLVKGGADQHVYYYNPPARTSDTGLHSPVVGMNNVPTISHYTFCYLAGDDDEYTGEGCTPGYWKTRAGSWGPTGYSTDTTVAPVFTEAAGTNVADATLHEALSFDGGPDADGARLILMRAAVAALLNAAHPEIEYPRTEQEVIDTINEALAIGTPAAMLALADALDEDNNLGCPLNAHGEHTDD